MPNHAAGQFAASPTGYDAAALCAQTRQQRSLRRLAAHTVWPRSIKALLVVARATPSDGERLARRPLEVPNTPGRSRLHKGRGTRLLPEETKNDKEERLKSE